MTKKNQNREASPVERRLMSVEETAAYLGISPQTIYNQIHRRAKKKFPVKPKRVGRSIRFDRRDVDAYIEGL
jgi:excisionase family DNA binding protein